MREWRGVVCDNGCEIGMWGRLIKAAGLVEGAADGEWAAVEDVGVDHGGGHVAVAQKLLDSSNVVARLEEVGGEAVPEGVAGGWL